MIIKKSDYDMMILGHVAQSVKSLATDASLTVDPAGVASSILAWSHTFGD